MSKEGQITIQFNWIFLLIVGGIILFFFIGLVSVQKKSSEGAVSAELLSQLSTYFTGAGVSIGTVTVYDVPRMHLEFTCDEFVVNDKARRSFSNKVLFTPDEIDDHKMITWTLDWSVPFRVMNLLYITSPQIRYIVFYDPLLGSHENAFFKDFNRSFPPELNYQAYPVMGNDVSDFAFLSDYGNEKIQFINMDSHMHNYLVYQISQEYFNMDNSDMSLVEIEPVGNFMDSGAKVKFHSLNSTDWHQDSALLDQGAGPQIVDYVNSFDDVSLYGAIISRDLEKFYCTLEKMYSNLNRMSSILMMRSQNISNSYYNQCRQVHKKAADALMSLSGVSNPATIKTTAGLLDEYNKEARRYSCAPIY